MSVLGRVTQGQEARVHVASLHDTSLRESDEHTFTKLGWLLLHEPHSIDAAGGACRVGGGGGGGVKGSSSSRRRSSPAVGSASSSSTSSAASSLRFTSTATSSLPEAEVGSAAAALLAKTSSLRRAQPMKRRDAPRMAPMMGLRGSSRT